MSDTTSIRRANNQDAELLLVWRNDAETRKASHDSAEVQRDEHVSWLTKTIENPHRRLYIAEEDGKPVGTVRADYSKGVWELSWTTAPSARGRGVAKRMVALLAEQISEPIRAELRSENIASARIAEHAGMEFIEEVEGIAHYRRGTLNE